MVKKMCALAAACLLLIAVPASGGVLERIGELEDSLGISGDSSESILARLTQIEELIGIGDSDSLSITERLSRAEKQLGIESGSSASDSAPAGTGNSGGSSSGSPSSGNTFPGKTDGTGGEYKTGRIYPRDVSELTEKGIGSIHSTTLKVIRKNISSMNPGFDSTEIAIDPVRIWLLVTDSGPVSEMYDICRISFLSDRAVSKKAFAAVCYENVTLDAANPDRIFADSLVQAGDDVTLSYSGRKLSLTGFPSLTEAKQVLILDTGDEWTYTYLVIEPSTHPVPAGSPGSGETAPAQSPAAGGREETIKIPCGVNVPVSEFEYPDNSTRRYTKSEYAVLFAGNPRERYYKSQIFIDEIFARYGYDFTEATKAPAKAILAKYGDSDWYRTAVSYCPTQNMSSLMFSFMNPTEIYNINLVNEWQQEVYVESYS